MVLLGKWPHAHHILVVLLHHHHFLRALGAVQVAAGLAQIAFGFGSAQERATFRQLVKVSGIGAKTALGILSAMSAGELAQAVAQEDVGRLSSAPGIGKKTAERMVLELRGKLTPAADGGLLVPAPAADETDDIVSTLLALGYNEREARAAVKNLPVGTEVGEGVRLALKNLLK